MRVIGVFLCLISPPHHPHPSVSVAVRLAWSLAALFNVVTSFALSWVSLVARLETVVDSVTIAVLSAMLVFSYWVIVSMISR